MKSDGRAITLLFIEVLINLSDPDVKNAKGQQNEPGKYSKASIERVSVLRPNARTFLKSVQFRKYAMEKLA